MNKITPITSVRWAPLFSKQDLITSPSRKDGFSLAQEMEIRVKTASWIAAIGRRLRMPHPAIGTACVYFHKFFMRHSLKANNQFDVGAACLYLAGKTEECTKSIRELMRCCWLQKHVKLGKQDPPHKESVEGKELCNKIMSKELLLLQSVNFCFEVYHPHRFLEDALKSIIPKKEACTEGQEKLLKQTAQIAFLCAADSFRSIVCLYYPPQHIALAVLELAFRHQWTQIKNFYKKTKIDERWWQRIDKDLTYGTLREIVDLVVDVADSVSLNADEIRASLPTNTPRPRRPKDHKRPEDVHRTSSRSNRPPLPTASSSSSTSSVNQPSVSPSDPLSSPPSRSVPPLYQTNRHPTYDQHPPHLISTQHPDHSAHMPSPSPRTPHTSHSSHSSHSPHSSHSSHSGPPPQSHHPETSPVSPYTQQSRYPPHRGDYPSATGYPPSNYGPDNHNRRRSDSSYRHRPY